MVVLTGREADGDITGGCDLQVWEMAPPNHASLGIHLGLPVDEMLAVFEPSATSWSKRINNQVRSMSAVPSFFPVHCLFPVSCVCWPTVGHRGHQGYLGV